MTLACPRLLQQERVLLLFHEQSVRDRAVHVLPHFLQRLGAIQGLGPIVPICRRLPLRQDD